MGRRTRLSGHCASAEDAQSAARVLASFLVAALLGAATAGCRASTTTLAPFTSDGCSLFPDGTPSDRSLWCDCCFEHDIAYWRGGTREEREAADAALRDCIRTRTGQEALADLMYRGVRAGGHPALPTWYRWAYGWTFGRGYAPLTTEEVARARDRLGEYWSSHPQGYCPPRPP